MHLVKAKSILLNSNSMNIYRGCLHGCIYCDARSTCYQLNHQFEDIEVKENAIMLLENTLIKRREKCMISTGGMSDPYIPLEKDLKMTRKALKKIYQYGFGVSPHTKSDLILRDMDLLEKINKRQKVVVQITMTTYNDELSKIIEPNVATTSKRYHVLLECKKRNIPTVVWLTPMLPYINDSYENISGLLDYCKKANVKGIVCFDIGLTLREGNREYFYKQLDKHFPGLKNKYIANFQKSYEIKSPKNKELYDYIKNFCTNNNIIFNNEEVFKYLTTLPNKTTQLSLF